MPEVNNRGNPESVNAVENAVLTGILDAERKWRDLFEKDRDFKRTLIVLAKSFVVVVEDQARYYSLVIEDLDLTVRAYNVLAREGIRTVEELVEFTPRELLELRNLGETGLRSIVDGLAGIGRTLKEN